jgi:hypothetical protein
VRQAVAVGQVHVEEDEVAIHAAGQGQGLPDAAGHAAGVPKAFDDALEGAGKILVVVDDENVGHVRLRVMVCPLLSDCVRKSKILVRLVALSAVSGKTSTLAAGFFEAMEVNGNLESEQSSARLGGVWAVRDGPRPSTFLPPRSLP